MSFSTARTILASGARTASGVGSAVDLGVHSSADLLLDVTAVSGQLASLLVTLDTSRDGVIGWEPSTPVTEAAESASWPSIGEAGSGWVTFAGLSRRVRARYRITLIGTVVLSTLTYGGAGTLNGLTLLATVNGSPITVSFGTPASAAAAIGEINADGGGAILAAQDSASRLTLSASDGDGVLVITGGTALGALGLSTTLPSFTFSITGESVFIFGGLEDLDALGLPLRALRNRSTRQIDAAMRSTTDIMIGAFADRGFDMPPTAWGTDVRQCCAVGGAWTGLGVRGSTELEKADEPLYERYVWWFGCIPMTKKDGWIWVGPKPAGFIDATPDDDTGSGAETYMISDAPRGW